MHASAWAALTAFAARFALQESLGGNARTVMIAAISPSADAYFQTLSTLKYVERAKRIKTKAVVNQDSNATLVRELRSEIESLRAQLAASKQVRWSHNPVSVWCQH